MAIWKITDLWLGVLVCFGGFLSLAHTLNFDQYSRSYPLFLSVVHIIIGLGLIVTSVKKASESSSTVSKLYEETRGPVIVAMLLITWGILLNLNVGYLVSSIVIMPLTLYILGYHNAKRMIFGSLGIISAIFFLFYILFEVPLPLNPVLARLLGQ